MCWFSLSHARLLVWFRRLVVEVLTVNRCSQGGGGETGLGHFDAPLLVVLHQQVLDLRVPEIASIIKRCSVPTILKWRVQIAFLETENNYCANICTILLNIYLSVSYLCMSLLQGTCTITVYDFTCSSLQKWCRRILTFSPYLGCGVHLALLQKELHQFAVALRRGDVEGRPPVVVGALEIRARQRVPAEQEMRLHNFISAQPAKVF